MGYVLKNHNYGKPKRVLLRKINNLNSTSVHAKCPLNVKDIPLYTNDILT